MISKEEILNMIAEEIEEVKERTKDWNIPLWRIGTYKTLKSLEQKIHGSINTKIKN